MQIRVGARFPSRIGAAREPISDERHVPLGGVNQSGPKRYNGESILDSRLARSTVY
ncbi:hypothetical protein [Natronococcus sp. A-GB7]|uniref:hypothetical protein n=1 Tax=Natronococcus sp. A-GB7 TaxID=3037649 RepID=UPI00241E5EBF|nr:hypothetical protein [Natronococcus sp. A-GB7]MDG5819450.1 hypothetical protein [Natronococcus sp. A-GB7]